MNMVIKNERARAVVKYLSFAAIAAVAIMGALLFDGRHYAAATLVLVCLSLVLFLTGFDRRTTGTRRMVLVSVMTTLSVAGRLIPVIKPTTALTILAGMYLGPQAGFLTGALSAVISNFHFGQGPWTPFQMLAWGLCGYIAGLLANPLERMPLLVVYGVVSGVLFSAVMDVWTVMWTGAESGAALYAAALVTALPHTVMYCVSNAVFLLLLAKPIGSKLRRIKIKYGV